MTKSCRDYYWKEGKPYEYQPTSEPLSGISYKIISDPYYKRISIEQYENGRFSKVVYDSAFFDFRHLKPMHQTAWQKATIEESDRVIVCHIRNQDDRLILIEEYQFENNLCRLCKAFSPQGNLVSLQKIFYRSFNDSFDGVILYDSNAHPITSKRYTWDSKTCAFTDLIDEQWDMSQKISYLL